jgi:hypothetical protein
MSFGQITSLELPEIAAIYEKFSALESLFPHPVGRLLLHAYFDRDGAALSIASKVAGGASLCIEPEFSLAKQALRAGVCDFIANDIDEALRILKNETRKGHAVSVALTGEPEPTILESLERGLQPDVVHLQNEGREIPGAGILLAHGARSLPAIEPSSAMIAVHWSVAREPQRWLPQADVRAAQALYASEPSTPQRKRWIENSPRHLCKSYATQRFLPMTRAEADAFFAAVQRDVEGGEIQVAVSVVRNGEEELVLS